MQRGKGGRGLAVCRLLSARRMRVAVARPIALAALLLASAFAFAQSPPPRPDAGAILEQQRQPIRLPQPPPDELRPRPPEPRPALPLSPTLRVRVTQFTFTGNTLFTDEHLNEVIQEFIGKELDFEGLNDAATKVRAYHRERGYFLAQAYLPQQAIRSGVVEIAVVEGRIGEVELQRRPASRLGEWLLLGILGAHLKPGDVITETSLEKPLLLINDLPTAAVTSEIRPSATVGAADVRVNVDQSVGYFNGFLDFDNHGARSTGEYRAGANLSVNNPLTIGDQLTLRGFGTTEDMTFLRGAYLVPVGYWGTRVGASYAEFNYRLGEDFAALGANGDGVVKSVYAFHPFYRTRNTNAIVQFAYEDKRLHDRTDSLGTSESRFIDSIKGGLVGDFRDGVLGGGLNAFSVTYTQGDLKIAPTSVMVADQSATGLKTAGTFRKWNYDYKRLNRVTDNSNVLFALTGQQASKNLASAEKMSLGGPDRVRAYPVGEATGDTGLFMQGEFRYIFPGIKFFEGDVTVSAHYDWGQVYLNEKPLPTDTKNKRSIQGYGVGTSLGREGDFIIRATASWRGDEERPQADTAMRDPRVWVQAVKWF